MAQLRIKGKTEATGDIQVTIAANETDAASMRLAIADRLSTGGFWLGYGNAPHYNLIWIDPASYHLEMEIGDPTTPSDPENPIAQFLNTHAILWGFDAKLTP